MPFISPLLFPDLCWNMGERAALSKLNTKKELMKYKMLRRDFKFQIKSEFKHSYVGGLESLQLLLTKSRGIAVEKFLSSICLFSRVSCW